MPKASPSSGPFVGYARSSHLARSSENPDGVWSPQFLHLAALVRDKKSNDEILAALDRWLKVSGKPLNVERLGELAPEEAFQVLITRISPSYSSASLPPEFAATLRGAMKALIGRDLTAKEMEMANKFGRLAKMRQRHDLEPSRYYVNKVMGDQVDTAT